MPWPAPVRRTGKTGRVLRVIHAPGFRRARLRSVQAFIRKATTIPANAYSTMLRNRHHGTSGEPSIRGAARARHAARFCDRSRNQLRPRHELAARC